MEITVHTEGWFDAAHQLKGYKGNCSNLHGHTYKVEVWARGDDILLDKDGILMDFGSLKRLTELVDHKEITELMGVNTTAENLVQFFYDRLKQIYKHLDIRVRVYEQLEPKRSWAEGGDF